MLNRTRKINGRSCVMVFGSKKMPSEQAAKEYAERPVEQDGLGLTDYEVARTGVSTWRVYTSDEPKVEKKPREKKEKKEKTVKPVEDLKEVIVELKEAVEDLEEAVEEVESEKEGSEGESETTPAQTMESSSVANDITEFGKSIIRCIRNCLDPVDPDFSDVGITTVAEKLGKKANAVSGALKTLVAKDYVTTLQDEEDGKPVSVICLTTKGWNAVI